MKMHNINCVHVIHNGPDLLHMHSEQCNSKIYLYKLKVGCHGPRMRTECEFKS